MSNEDPIDEQPPLERATHRRREAQQLLGHNDDAAVEKMKEAIADLREYREKQNE